MAVSPPRPRGPALNALRAFEAAARLGSFTAAAEELCVTPGAVAQHVKALEAWSGARLFRRHAQGVTLTELGRDLLPGFQSAFDQLGEAVQALRARAAPNQVRIAALPALAQLWLAPRLPALRSAAPDVEISITAMEQPPNLKRETFDLAIFFEAVPLGHGSIEVCRDVIFPVCAPALAARLKQPADLAHVPCLQDANWTENWTRWLSAATPKQSLELRGPVFSLYSLALEEARNGAGVLIGHGPLVQAQLDSGALVAPFRARVTLERALSIALAGASAANPALARILEALTADVRA